MIDLFFAMIPFLLLYFVAAFGLGAIGGWLGESHARKAVKAREQAVLRREQLVTFAEHNLREGAKAELAKAQHLQHAMDEDTLIEDWVVA